MPLFSIPKLLSGINFTVEENTVRTQSAVRKINTIIKPKVTATDAPQVEKDRSTDRKQTAKKKPHATPDETGQFDSPSTHKTAQFQCETTIVLFVSLSVRK